MLLLRLAGEVLVRGVVDLFLAVEARHEHVLHEARDGRLLVSDRREIAARPGATGRGELTVGIARVEMLFPAGIIRDDAIPIGASETHDAAQEGATGVLDHHTVFGRERLDQRLNGLGCGLLRC